MLPGSSKGVGRLRSSRLAPLGCRGSGCRCRRLRVLPAGRGASPGSGGRRSWGGLWQRWSAVIAFLLGAGAGQYGRAGTGQDRRLRGHWPQQPLLTRGAEQRMLPGAATQGQAGAGGQAAHVPRQQVRELLPTGHQAVYCCRDCTASLMVPWMYYSTSLI